ncbi:MAG: proline racemase family protein [Acidobacteriaceae bacterium]|nr:proline racemase family protein [Acidobacteriaceae bacterium]
MIDSHTEGEPTRVVVEGGPDLGSGSMQERLEIFRSQFDSFRAGVCCEPRGSEVVVGALLCEPVDRECVTGVIFFNDIGYLGMCGHGTIGVVRTLAHLGRLQPGRHKIETPVGIVEAELLDDGSVRVRNVESYRYKSAVPVEVPGFGTFTGDIAWGGNWFFLIGTHPFELTLANRHQLVQVSHAIRESLARAGVTGADGAYIDHIELFGKPVHAENSSRNFVLCPGASFDRSPCGTGTSAKMACLYADGVLKVGQQWRQESILGTHFVGTVQGVGDRVLPTIQGKAWITGESTLLFDETDPFRGGILY